MSFDNRDYAKRDAYPDQGWTRAVQWLVVANVAVYLLAFLATKSQPGASARDVYGLVALVPADVLHGHRLWQVLTYAFVHDLQNPFHLILDMYLLWVAGRDLEFMYGTARFLRFYAAAAIFTAALYLVIAVTHPEIRSTPLFGSSGAVMAVLVVYASYHPGDKILLFLIYEVPIWVGVIVMLATDLAVLGYSTEARATAGGCALGGAAFGFAWHRLSHHLEAAFARVPASVPAHAPRRIVSPPASPPSTTAALEAELDDVLRKLHAKGMGGLTDDEKGVLERASKHYRAKR
jgi:membrane associated rhomboid family serine protease